VFDFAGLPAYFSSSKCRCS